MRLIFAAVVSFVCFLTSPAFAQAGAQLNDPFGGRFGAAEVALSPAEALRQHALMETALAGLAPQRPGQLDVYVVAVGLWGDPVFESEATQTASALTQSLGAQGRTIVLSAGAGTAPRNYPAATPMNIQSVLGRVGQALDPAEDLVVLFFTSHGNQQGLALHEQNRVRGVYSPMALSASLRDAGITRRVVILSACYSGVFVPALANDDTIVLTAASRDRQSFGCQPEREWTYFGDAVVNQGLRAGKPLLQAFDDGVGLIAQWEQRDRFTPSNPQSHRGPRAMEALRSAEAAASRAANGSNRR